MAAMKAKDLIHLDLGLNFVILGCLPADGIVQAFRNQPFFILVTNSCKKQQLFDKHKALRSLDHYVCTILSTGARQQASKYE